MVNVSAAYGTRQNHSVEWLDENGLVLHEESRQNIAPGTVEVCLFTT